MKTLYLRFKHADFWDVLAIGLFVATLIVGAERLAVHAQSAQAYTMAGSAAHTTCLTPVVGSYFLCVATDGIWVSNNGATYFQILSPAASTVGTVTSVNAIKPDSTGNVTLAIPSTAALPSQTLTLK